MERCPSVFNVGALTLFVLISPLPLLSWSWLPLNSLCLFRIYPLFLPSLWPIYLAYVTFAFVIVIVAIFRPYHRYFSWAVLTIVTFTFRMPYTFVTYIFVTFTIVTFTFLTFTFVTYTFVTFTPISFASVIFSVSKFTFITFTFVRFASLNVPLPPLPSSTLP